jgi:hypothetical protein
MHHGSAILKYLADDRKNYTAGAEITAARHVGNSWQNTFDDTIAGHLPTPSHPGTSADGAIGGTGGGEPGDLDSDD